MKRTDWQRIVACIFVAVILLLTSYRGLSETHEAAVDSSSYLLDESGACVDLLRSFRTPVYPLFLSLTGASLDNYRYAAVLQCVFYAAGILIIYHQISTFLLTPLAAMLAAFPLATASVLGFYGNEMLPETMGAALAFISLSTICCRDRESVSIKREIITGVLVLLAVLCKPQYAFLCGVHLISAAVLMRSRRGTDSFWRNFKCELPRVVLPILPLVLYCVLRLFLVGHFGIVSFGGTNMAGIALNPAMFSKTTVDILPSPELKAIGRSIIERREELIDRSRRDAKFRGEDPAVRIHEVLDAEKFKLGGSFSDWVQCYNVNIWDVARPAVATSLGYQQQVLTPTQSKEVDGILAQLSSCAISANRMLYVRYVSGALAYSLNRSVRQERWSARLMTVLLAMLLFFSGVLAALLLGRSVFLPFRSGVCLTMAMVCASAVLWEDVSGMTFYIWGWVPGTISPELLPVVAVFYGLFSGGSYLLVGYSRVFNDAQFSRDHAAACCSAYCFGVMLLVSLVEAPLDRYLMTAWPVMCSLSAAMLGLAVQRLLQGLRLHIFNRY